MANLADDHESVVRSIKADDHFFFECVNMGVPLGTASDRYRSFERVLGDVGIKGTHVPRRHGSAQSARPNIDATSKIKCMSAPRKCPEHIALDTADCHGSVRPMRVDTQCTIL